MNTLIWARSALVRAARACGISALALMLSTSLISAGASSAYATESPWGGGSVL